MLRAVGLVITCAALAGTGPALANVGAELAQIDRSLADLPIGKGRDALHQWFKERMDRAALTTIAAATDYAEKERLRAQRDQELAALVQGEVAFDSADAKWDVSLVAGEFGRGTGESMIVWRRREETLYFFLREGVLWKVARQLDLGESFAHRLAHWSSTFRSEGAVVARSADSPTEVVWARDTLDVRLVNRRLLYGGDLLIIESRKVANALASARAEAAVPAVSKSKGTDDLEDFFLPDNER